VKNKYYRIKGNSKYFRRKYGTPNPIVLIKGEDKDIWSGGWTTSRTAVCQIYGVRVKKENLPISGKVYYGKINEFEDLVHESELGEEIVEDGANLKLKPCLA
jgi:hypothetical protein